jgi:hypothetical protein
MNAVSKKFPLPSEVEPVIADRLDTIIAKPDSIIETKPSEIADELLKIGETILESWLEAKGIEPTVEKHEGFRLLALHRQGARGDPSFNACRETCRELVYHYNCIRLLPHDGETIRRIRYAAMVARHLLFFVDGKLENSGLGEFCCSSRSVRLGDAIRFERKDS